MKSQGRRETTSVHCHTVEYAKTHRSHGPVPAIVPERGVFVPRGKQGQGTSRIPDKQRRRYQCKVCKKTLSERQGTMFEGLRKPTELIVIVVMLLSYGCPVQAIVQAFGLDERTVAEWRDRAGKHGQRVHEAIVEQGQLDLVHIQADELRVKGRKMIAWMGLAMMVSTRLWVAGAVSLSRDKGLADT